MNIFTKAADILIEGGHCKDALEDGTAHCALGALLVAEYGTVYPDNPVTLDPATGLYSHRSDAYTQARNMLREAVGGALISVWNNAPERTGQDVIRVFKELAAKMDAEIGEENPKIVEFEPVPETTPAPTPAPAEEPAPA